MTETKGTRSTRTVGNKSQSKRSTGSVETETGREGGEIKNTAGRELAVNSVGLSVHHRVQWSHCDRRQ